MPKLYTLTMLAALWLLSACGSSKQANDDGRITDRKLNKLISDYSQNPRDTALARQVRYAYDVLLADRMAKVQANQYGSTLREKEQLLNAYIDLQKFYDDVRRYPAVSQLVSPGHVGAEIETTRLQATAAYYEAAEQALADNNWKTSRQAYTYLQKVQQWMPEYKNSRQMMRQAKEQGIVDVVVLPVSADGFYYQPGMPGTGMGYGPQLHDQLARDLGGRYNSNNAWRIWADNGYSQYRNDGVDWTLEPVWTYLRYNEPRTTTRTEERTKQIEIGKDTANRPIYQTLKATLTIFERNTELSGVMELRLYDVVNRERISNNSFRESHRIQQRWATYRGDAGALNNADWELMNSNQGNNSGNRPNDRETALMEQRLLEKMYPNMLQHLRTRLNY